MQKNVAIKKTRNKDSAWREVDVFPHISQVIAATPRKNDAYVGHDAIVSAMLVHTELAALISQAKSKLVDRDATWIAANMLDWFSTGITKNENPWAEFFDRERRDGKWSDRPKLSSSAELIALEGQFRLVFHRRRERDPELAQAKRRAAGVLRCEACDFTMSVGYPGLDGDVFEVHHRRPLAEATGSIKTKLEDLAILCANCHRAIHQTKPLMSVEQFRSQFFSHLAQFSVT